MWEASNTAPPSVSFESAMLTFFINVDCFKSTAAYIVDIPPPINATLISPRFSDEFVSNSSWHEDDSSSGKIFIFLLADSDSAIVSLVLLKRLCSKLKNLFQPVLCKRYIFRALSSLTKIFKVIAGNFQETNEAGINKLAIKRLALKNFFFTTHAQFQPFLIPMKRS